jgi:hypothetical protein
VISLGPKFQPADWRFGATRGASEQRLDWSSVGCSTAIESNGISTGGGGVRIIADDDDDNDDDDDKRDGLGGEMWEYHRSTLEQLSRSGKRLAEGGPLGNPAMPQTL